MELTTAIKTRRSVRKYTDQPLSQDQIDTLLEAIRWAPSWTNSQTWEVILVTEPETKAALSETLGKNPATKAVATAPVVFALAAKLETSGFYSGQPSTNKGDWFMFDSGLATQNLCLTAHEMGLGTVIVGLFDADKVDEILNIPEGYAIVVLVPVGYPGKDPKTPPRKETAEFTHQEKW